MTADNTAGKIICDDALLSRGFTRVPNVVLQNPDLSVGARLAYGALLSYLYPSGEYPGQAAMAEEFGIGKRSANRYLKELVDKGFLRVTRHGLGQANTYEILMPWKDETAPANGQKDVANPESPNWRVRETESPNWRVKRRQNGKSSTPNRQVPSIEEDVDVDVTTEDSLSLRLAKELCAAIGQPTPSGKMLGRALLVINGLTAEGYGEDAITEAIALAAAKGAEWPDYLPYVIGKAQSRVHARHAEEQKQVAVREAVEASAQAQNEQDQEGLELVAALSPEELAEREEAAREELGMPADRFKGYGTQMVVRKFVVERLLAERATQLTGGS